MAAIQKITPHLWFNNQAEEAVKFYTSIFKNSKTGRVARYSKEGFEIHKMPEGTVMTMEFYLEGQQFLALNGGPHFTFNEAISFVVQCDSQEEIDYYWDKLTAGGDPGAQQCGWLKDRFGLSWQIEPTVLPDILFDNDRNKADRVMHEILKMKKPDISALLNAYDGLVKAL